ncbi:MAG: 50S ribosomal protein L32 [Chlamydiales bacterium]|nr:50S ribosomal protein L32 [Chlamydiales bacterium]NCF71828.1 50S ribosomal protein L32 [Chlamydiales bacterium]
MAVPRNRVSNAKKNSRRAHHAKSPIQLSACSSCGKMRKSHTICPHCGYYAATQQNYAKASSSSEA